MKAKIKKDLTEIIEKSIVEYSSDTVEDKSKLLANLIKEINIVKEIENQEVDISIKKSRLKLDQDKLIFEKEKDIFEKEKFEFEKIKFENLKDVDKSKLDIELSKLHFEKTKLDIEVKISKKDKVFNGIMKGLEIGVPLIINTGLSLLVIKLTQIEDGIIPASMKDFIKHIYKK